MKALLLFHLRVGVRVAVRSFVPLFCAALVWVILQMEPAAFVTMIAVRLYAAHPPLVDYSGFALLAFLLPLSATPRLVHGLNGWMRHLPISGVANRRGLAAALIMVQLPLAATLLLLGLVARGKGLAVLMPAVRLALLLMAGAAAAVPARKRSAAFALSAGATGVLVTALPSPALSAVVAAALLAMADVVSGPLREARHTSHWRTVGGLLDFRIALRALGLGIVGPYAASLVPIGAALLFIANNDPPPAISGGASRLGACMALTLGLSGITDQLLLRRPVWPWLRSLPASALGRVSIDSYVLAVLVLPILILAAAMNPIAALCALSIAPTLSFRAAACLRRERERKAASAGLLMEGTFISATVALLPMSCLFWLAFAPAALTAARQAELKLKPTRWVERHHLSAGDSLSWSE
jgi:hypothetical protein